MTNDILARIDAARRSDSPHDMRMALYAAGAEIARLSALIPEPPADDEREALAATIADFGVGDSAGPTRFDYALADALMASPVWRNRGRGPITDEEIERVAGALYFEDCGERVSDEYRATPDFDAAFRSYARVALEAARGAEGMR